ncbi:MAG TPA: ACP phosphodiesterase [Halioglobus sp.]
MNFLAHFHLAGPDEELITGGLEGDYIKGPLRGELPQGLERGIKLHRAIDANTDSHPMIQQLSRDLLPDLRRYAGILIDLSFDHYLSRHWAIFSAIPIADFNSEIYRTLTAHAGVLSEGGRVMAARLVEHDVLNLYREWETVLATATRIGQRFQRRNPFLELDQKLSPAQSALEQAFLNFYPQLQSFSTERAALLRSPEHYGPLR